ncbi:Transmembrane protein 43 [compost metagenome]
MGGLIGLFIGFTLMLSLISIIADIIPVLGSVVGFGTGVIAAILTLIIGPLVIAIAWFAYRPLLPLAIVAVGALIAFGIGYRRAGKAKPITAGVTA